MASPRYFYRAFFKTDGLNLFEGFDTGLRDGKGLGFAQAWHKGCWDGSPFAVYNEFIGGEIGRFIRLPVPPFCLTHHDAGEQKEPLFSSLDFGGSRSKLPEIIPGPCVENLGPLCAGVLALDIFIANSDRHEENLVVDDVGNPKQMHVFDQGQALFGGNGVFGDPTGIDRFNALKERLGVTGGPQSGGIPHVFLPLITNGEHLFYWVKRIRDIPKWFIQDVCKEARAHGLDRTLADACVEFLIYRRNHLSGIIRANQAEFAIQDWPPENRELFDQ